MSKSTTSKKFWCGDCEKGWVRKVDFDNHFTLQNVKEKDGARLIPNICYNRKRKTLGATLSEATESKKTKPLSFPAFTAKKSTPEENNLAICDAIDLSDPVNVSATCSSTSQVVSAKEVVQKEESYEKEININQINKKLDDVLDAVKKLPGKVKEAIQDNSQKEETGVSSSATDKEYRNCLNDIK